MADIVAGSPVITLLAGGVGGAKAAEGLALGPYAKSSSVIGNIADDESFHGLWVSPDIDTLTYSLANLIDRQQGWGLTGDSHRVLGALQTLGCDTWMSLGDMDLATHIYRTQQRHLGVSPSHIADHIARQLGVTMPILLPTDDVVQTQIKTAQGWISFQEYFVKQGCTPAVLDIRFAGAEQAKPCANTLDQIARSDVILLAPSNPIVSIGAILAVPTIRQHIVASDALTIAISPIIGGKTVKGPADVMLKYAGYTSDVLGVAAIYQGLIDVLVIDQQDAIYQDALEAQGLQVLVTNTLMKTSADKEALLTQCLQFVEKMLPRRVA